MDKRVWGLSPELLDTDGPEEGTEEYWLGAGVHRKCSGKFIPLDISSLYSDFRIILIVK